VAQRRGARQPLAIVGDVVMYTRCPVLMVPQGAGRLDLAGPVVVAWNGSAEAAHALRLALPLLKRAEAVHLVEVNDDAPEGGGDHAPAHRRIVINAFVIANLASDIGTGHNRQRGDQRRQRHDSHVHRKGGVLRLGHAKQRDDHGQKQAA
jgi:hypothetical protein